MTAQKLIVVGIDGSDAAAAALRWTCGETISTGAIIEVVHAFRPNAGQSPEVDDASARSSRLLTCEVWVALAAINDSPRIRFRSQPGGAAAVLLSRSARAGLLVLGAPEYAAGDTDRSGSIAAMCQQNARCPVAIISRLGQPLGRTDAQQRVPEQRPDPRYSFTAPPDSSSVRGGLRRPPDVKSRESHTPVHATGENVRWSRDAF